MIFWHSLNLFSQNMISIGGGNEHGVDPVLFDATDRIEVKWAKDLVMGEMRCAICDVSRAGSIGPFQVLAYLEKVVKCLA